MPTAATFSDVLLMYLIVWRTIGKIRTPLSNDLGQGNGTKVKMTSMMGRFFKIKSQ